MKQLTMHDLEYLSFGSAILGSGGGGDPAYSLLMAKHHLEQYGQVTVISVEELQADDVVVPLALMGAPLVTMERLFCSKELEGLLTTIERYLGRKPTVLMAGEIGGANAFAPLLIAAKLGLPVLDADLLGRAFPELQMNSCNLQGYSASPAVIADCLGNTVIINTPSVKTSENLARGIAVSMGSSAGIALHIMNGLSVQGAVIPGTLSQAIAIGKAICEAKKAGSSPIAALIEHTGAHLLAKGVLVDIRQEIKGGFLQGSVTLLQEESKIQLLYQNEYLLASSENRVLASTPDILMLIEETSGTPITSGALRYGARAALIAIPAPAIWQTKEGLALVGPHVFGYGIDYVPIPRAVENVTFDGACIPIFATVCIAHV